jgi:hypothetical protein
MNITVYLPDELGSWAKDSKINLSARLRASIEDERDRREAASATLDSAQEYELFVEGKQGKYTARMHGAEIAEDRNGEIRVFLGQDRNLYLYDQRDLRLHRRLDPDELGSRLSGEAYADAMRALGRPLVIDVGLPEHNDRLVVEHVFARSAWENDAEDAREQMRSRARDAAAEEGRALAGPEDWSGVHLIDRSDEPGYPDLRPADITEDWTAVRLVLETATVPVS